MKKNLVFIIPSLEAGGAEKSLVNLLNTIDYQKYSVDLVLFKSGGVFAALVPKQVNFVTLNPNFQQFSRGLFSSCLYFALRFQFRLVFHRIAFFLTSRIEKNEAVAEQKNWKHMRAFITILPKKYDAAIGFLEKTSNYFAVDCVQATTKIGWIHTTYSNSGMDATWDAPYFEQFKAVIGVSPECVADLQNNFPHLKDRFQLIYNIVSPSLIGQLAAQECEDDSLFATPTTFVTIARLSPEKGLDLAIEAAKLLVEKGLTFKWLILGDGVERERLKMQIKTHQLEDYVFLLGVRQNPYPYVKRATVYVQPSRYEGKSMAIEEAKILQKPVVVTAFSSALDQIEPNVTGFIADMEGESIAHLLLKVSQDASLCEQVQNQLKTLSLGTESEIDHLYQLIEAHG
ncbi:glycosyltransferase [Flavobacterium sp. N1719]|uniref:glycosyltransferase n=1 Tax=Flavobacterium sp. N1719 TaxID=2885633 RepID=UPI00222328EE|nr:glycosyltransferase [Flavobacterium sp. N1719]